MAGYMCYSLNKAANITIFCSASYAGTKHLRTKKDRGTNSMSRPTSKTDLMTAAADNYRKLNALIDGLTEKELTTEFDFAADEKKKEAHWKRDKNLRDVLIHLYEWHQLLLSWVQANQNGEEKPFLPRPYNWKTYGEMNVF